VVVAAGATATVVVADMVVAATEEEAADCTRACDRRRPAKSGPLRLPTATFPSAIGGQHLPNPCGQGPPCASAEHRSGDLRAERVLREARSERGARETWCLLDMNTALPTSDGCASPFRFMLPSVSSCTVSHMLCVS